MVRIYCDQPGKELKNFWNHIVFHPTNAIGDDWGRQYLDRIARDGAAKSVRVYTMFEEIVTQDENGGLVFDFATNDERLDYLLSRGFDILLVYSFIPPWLSAETDEELVKPRYKGAYFHRSYPSDYGKWEEMCRIYTRHIVDRYGEDVVSGWRIHCYNEPDKWHFFYANAPSFRARAAEFAKLYDAFEQAVTSVSDRLCIGACGFADAYEFLVHFLRHIRESGRRLDFLSCHPYGTMPAKLNDGTKPLHAYDSYPYLKTVREITEMCGFGHLPLVCDEWGASEEGYMGCEQCPAHIFRETEVYAAYYVKQLMFFDTAAVRPEVLMICLSGQHDLETDFGGHRNFFSKSFYPKPIYNAHVLAGKLGDEKLCCYVDFLEDQLTALASRSSSDGRMAVLLCYADPGFHAELPDHTAQILFDGLDGTYRVKKYVIDHDHANAYTKFLELGSPQEADEQTQALIRQAGELVCEDAGILTSEQPQLELTMTNNAVVLLELERV